MSLSQECTQRVYEAARNEKLYYPQEAIRRELGNRSLVMVVAPAAMGKSFLMNHVSRLDTRFGRASVRSTRDARDDDEPGMFRLYSHTDENVNALLQKIDDRNLVQYAIHPTELTFYGSELQDYPHQYNMLATLSGAVDQLQSAGFEQTTVVGLTAPPGDWKHWFDARYKTSDPHRLKRLREAGLSYNALLERKDVRWVVNHEGYIDDAAHDVIHTAEGKRLDSDEAAAYVHRILQLIEDETARAYTETHD